MGSVLVLHAFGGLWVVGSQPAGALLLFQWLPCAIFDTADEMVGGLSDFVYVAALSQHLCTVVFKVYCLPCVDFMSHLRD